MMKEQKQDKQEKPEQEQKPLRQGQPEETQGASNDEKAGSTPSSNGVRDGTEGGQVRPLSPAQKLSRPESSKMHSETSSRKSHGRLTRDAMKIIGKTLEAYYDDVRKEGTPDRFKQLLQQFDERKGHKDKESS
jgi:hypothetical protein